MLTHKTRRLLIITCLFIAIRPVFGQTIPKLTPELEDKLLAVLDSQASFQEKAGACRQLSVAGSDKSIPVLIGLLSDEKLSHMARYGLETLPGTAVEKALRQALDDLQGKPLVGVIGTLGVRRDALAVEPLIELVHHKDTEVSQAALRALGSIGDAEATEALQTALAHAPAVKRLGLYEGLLRCAETQAALGNDKAALAIYESLQERKVPFQVRSAALRSIILQQGPDDPVLLRQCLGSDDYAVFSAAVQTALGLPDERITRILTEALTRQRSDFQVLLVNTLGNRADVPALASLHKASQRGDQQVRLAAIKALSQIGHKSTAPVLADLCQDRDAQVAQAAKSSLAAFPKHADPVVMDMFRSGDVSERLIALELITLRRMTDSVPLLLLAVKDPDARVRAQSLKTIGQLGGAAELASLLSLLQKLDDRDLEAMRLALTDICSRVKDPDACVTQLIEALSRSTVKQKLVLFRVLSSVEGNLALKVVRSAVDDSNPEIHLGAIRALSQWHNADVAPDLLVLVQTAENTRDRTLCLRGYLRIAERADLPGGQRLDMCEKIKPLLNTTAEKQQWLGALGRIDSPRALAQIRPSFNDPAVRETACTVSLTSIERMVKKNSRLKQNASVTRTLQKIVETSTNADYQKRARRLLGES